MDVHCWVLLALAVVVAVVGLCSCFSQRVGEVKRATAQRDGCMSGGGQCVPPAPACTPACTPACQPAAQSHNIYKFTPMSASPAGAPAPYITYASSHHGVSPPAYPVLSEQPPATHSYPPSAPQLPRESTPAELDPEAQPQPYQQLQQLKHMTNNADHVR